MLTQGAHNFGELLMACKPLGFVLGQPGAIGRWGRGLHKGFLGRVKAEPPLLHPLMKTTACISL